MASKKLCCLRNVLSGRFDIKKDFCRMLNSSSVAFNATGSQGGDETGNCGGESSTSSAGDGGGGGLNSGDNTKSPPFQIPSGGVFNRFDFKRRRHRSTLSVADRISQMLPQDSDHEVRETDVQSSSFSNYYVAMQQDGAVSDSSASRSSDDGNGTDFSANPEGDLPFVAGEIVVASRENPKRHEYLKKMFTISPSKNFNCKFGAIKHSEIIGRYPGDNYILSKGFKISIERASLEDYIVHMKRTPVISYPKDCITMCMLIDANPGDTILEAGSGSGGMTLYLSRAVGPTGHVHAFEINEKHHGRAVKNFNRWQQSWNLSRPEKNWPSNVIFHHQRLQDGDDTLGDMLFDGAIIDMQNPHLTMPFVARRLKAGRAVAVYLTNLTQVIQTLEYIEAKKVPLENARVVDVTHRTWCVVPARRHDGQLVKSVKSNEEEIGVYNEYQDEDSSSEDSSELDEFTTEHAEDEQDEQVYLAKPTFYQHPHTAFLLKLRKCKPM